MKKILIIFAGIVLIILGLIIIISFISSIGAINSLPRGAIQIWQTLIVLSSPVLIVSGIKLFSFKKVAQKLALFSYGIVLLHTVIWNVLGYYVSIYIAYGFDRSSPFSIKNIIAYFSDFPNAWLGPFLCMLFPIFFIGVLFFTKEQFENKK